MTTINNTIYSFVAQGTDDGLTQARFDRARNSRLFLAGNRVIKRGTKGATEREFRMLTQARKLGVSVPHCTLIDDCTLSLQFIPHGETVWDHLLHNTLTKSMLTAVKSALTAMWKAGIVHGDLHINNILVDTHCNVYIIDMASSWDAQVLVDTFGEGDYSVDIKEGIIADKAAFKASLLAAHAELS
jgi:RIO-like serine/threonine protein kinase